MNTLVDHAMDLRNALEALPEVALGPFSVALRGIESSITGGGKVIIFGNGGSAADAQHFAAELVSSLHGAPFPAPIPAIALTTDSSTLTAIANDDEFANIFGRQVEALAKSNDVVVGLTTSGSSENVLRGLEAARTCGAFGIAIVGQRGLVRDCAAVEIRLPSVATQVVQALTIVVLHSICEELERLRVKGNRAHT